MLHKIWAPGVLGQWVAAVTACLCTTTAGMAFSWPAAAMPLIISGEAGFTLTDLELSWLVTSMFVGNIVSPIPAGYIMDRIGRKNTLMISLLITIASWFIIYFTTSATWLYIARFLAGMWIGVVFTVVPVFIGEVVKPSIRGSMAALYGMQLFVGSVFESVAALWSYDILTITSSVLPILLLVAILFLPESPYYHMLKNQSDKAKESITWLNGSCSDTALAELEEKVKNQLMKKGRFIDLIQRGSCRKAFFIVEVLNIIQRCASLTLLTAYSSVMLPHTFVTPQQSFTILCCVWTIGSFYSTFILDRYDRRTSMRLSCVGAGTPLAVVSIWYFLRDQMHLDMSNLLWMPLALLVVSGAFYALGLVSIPQLQQGELFPVNLKAKGSAIAAMTQSLTSAIVLRLYLPLTESVGVYTNFVICAIACLAGFFFSMFGMIETKGKTLEEIQDILENVQEKPRI